MIQYIDTNVQEMASMKKNDRLNKIIPKIKTLDLNTSIIEMPGFYDYDNFINELMNNFWIETQLNVKDVIKLRK